MWKKLIEFIGLSEEEEAVGRKEDEYLKEAQTDTTMQKKGAVVNLHTQKQVKLFLCEPEAFEEAQAVADQLRSHRPVVLNLHKAQFDHAVRIIDFISGTIYALGGRMEKIGHQIFLCTPENVEIQGKISDILKQQGEAGSTFQNVK